jgi:hypothetical protein
MRYSIDSSHQSRVLAEEGQGYRLLIRARYSTWSFSNQENLERKTTRLTLEKF